MFATNTLGLICVVPTHLLQLVIERGLYREASMHIVLHRDHWVQAFARLRCIMPEQR